MNSRREKDVMKHHHQYSLGETYLLLLLLLLFYCAGTVMFLHWLAGMIFIFYFASFVVLLREVLRPGVLWFLRNLNDQNFHPIQDVSIMTFCHLVSSILFFPFLSIGITSFLLFLPLFLPPSLPLFSSS